MTCSHHSAHCCTLSLALQTGWAEITSFPLFVYNLGSYKSAYMALYAVDLFVEQIMSAPGIGDVFHLLITFLHSKQTASLPWTYVEYGSDFPQLKIPNFITT